MLVIYTLGYEGRSLEEYPGILSESLVTAIVDVREEPYGRKPGLAKRIVQFLSKDYELDEKEAKWKIRGGNE